ncbi:CLIP-associating protein 1 [Paragonimus heterotremus]|uniref:CLIP-associating protein 1 n=1 Tax=Paragonimus heterotremus TaxID=100268 RepID=A0A8J4SSF5_9TREM|nr:CLIP-associating protein 1 [Paragonimus heterotremus]
MEIIFRLWPVNVLEKHLGLVQDSLRRGICDADSDARVFARHAFPLFAAKFPDQANVMLQNLDAQKRKLVEKDMIAAGLAAGAGDVESVRSRSNSQTAIQNRAAPNPITKRPTKPVLGTTAIVSAASRSRPPVTTLNDYNTVGRYIRQGSMAATIDGRGRVPGRKTVSQSQPVCESLSESAPCVLGGSSQCTVVNYMVTTGLRIIPDFTLSDWEVNKSLVFDVQQLNESRPHLSSETSFATSREVSPSRLTFMSYGITGDGQQQQQQQQQLPYNAAGYATRNGMMDRQHTVDSSYRQGPTSRIPRSQGASRETSPSRSATGGYPTAATPFQHQEHSGFNGRGANFLSYRGRTRPSMSAMSDCGDSGDMTLATSRQPFESDDNFSETSSQCSDRSGRSIPGFRRQHQTRVTSNLKEILTLLSGSQWSDRKDGLINLQNYMRSGNPFSPEDIRRLTDVFSKMFADSQSKVVSLFMDTLQFFIKEYNPLLRDWLYTLLIRLLNRQGAEVLGSHQKAIQETLFVLRSHFPLNLQFSTCCRFVMDNTQATNLKVKGCLLEYLKDLILMMTPDMISSPSPEINLAISRIITWSAEPKSADVRRMASRVVIKLYDLNPASFSALLQALPRAIQDRASEVLKAYQKTTTGGGISNLMDSGHSTPAWRSTSVDQDRQMSREPYSPSDSQRLSPETMQNMIRQTTEGLQSLTTGIPAPGSAAQRRISADNVMTNPSNGRLGLSHVNGTNDVSSAVLRTVQPNNFNQSPSLSHQSSAIAPSSVSNSYAAPLIPLSESARFGGPLNYDQGDGPKLKKPVIGYQTLRKIREMPPEDIMSEILQELSNHNERHEQRKACMLKLIKLLRDGAICNWDEYFKPTLLILLETLGDDGYETRALALKVLQELVRTKPELFHDFAYLFVIKVLDACRDEEKTVIRSAEDCAKSIAQSLPPDLCFSVLTPLINDWSLQINLPAIKMQEHVVRHSSPDLVHDVMEAIIPGLIVACNHEDSAMRKASIFCLVAIAMKIGDAIWEHLTELHVSKRRLLKLYIDRELNSNSTPAESPGPKD